MHAEIQWVPNGDAPKSRTVSLVEYFSMENDRVSLENLESSEPRDLQNLCLKCESLQNGNSLRNSAHLRQDIPVL